MKSSLALGIVLLGVPLSPTFSSVRSIKTMLFHKFSRNRGRLFGEVESAFKNYTPKKLVKPETWFFFPNLESPFFRALFFRFQQPFNFSCCYFAPGLDRLAAARDVTVSVTLADEERTGHLGMKRRFQQRLRKNVKNVGLTMLRRKCGSCFFLIERAISWRYFFWTHVSFNAMYFLHFIIDMFVTQRRYEFKCFTVQGQTVKHTFQFSSWDLEDSLVPTQSDVAIEEQCPGDLPYEPSSSTHSWTCWCRRCLLVPLTQMNWTQMCVVMATAEITGPFLL